VDAVLAARAAGQSQWGSELPPLFLLLVLQCVGWSPAVCSVIRAVCSTWSSIHDALRPGRLGPRHSAVTMQGKLSWFKSLTELDLRGCGDTVSGVMVGLESMPCLRSLTLPSSCAGRAVDAEAVCAITTLTTLHIWGWGVNEVGEWMLDMSMLTTLTTLWLRSCSAVKDKQVLELSHLTGLTNLSLDDCRNVTSEGLQTLSSLTALTTLSLYYCLNVTSEGLRTVSSLTSLSDLDLSFCNVSDEVLRALSSLTVLSTLNLFNCNKVTAAAKQALRIAIPNLTIRG
jgi:Leucine-rich repeat (LRR) protein